MSRLKYDYAKEKHTVEALGGLGALEAVKRQAEGLDLPPCPFCGGEAVVALRTAFGLHGASVECSRCHTGTIPFFARVDLMSQKTIDIHDAVSAAAGRWGMRKEAAE